MNFALLVQALLAPVQIAVMYILPSSLVILAVAATSGAFPGRGPPKGYRGLNDYAKDIGKVYFGTAADIPGPELQDNAYIAVLNNAHEFGQLTPTNYMKVFVLLGLPAPYSIY